VITNLENIFYSEGVVM